MKKFAMCILLGISVTVSCFAIDRAKINAEIRKFMVDKNASMIEIIDDEYGEKNYIKADFIIQIRYINDDNNGDYMKVYHTNGDNDEFSSIDIKSIQYVAPVLTITDSL